MNQEFSQIDERIKVTDDFINKQNRSVCKEQLLEIIQKKERPSSKDNLNKFSEKQIHYKQRLSKLMDFLDISQNKAIKKILQCTEKLNTCEIYTDFVYRFKSKTEKSRKIVLLTCNLKKSHANA